MCISVHGDDNGSAIPPPLPSHFNHIRKLISMVSIVVAHFRAISFYLFGTFFMLVSFPLLAFNSFVGSN